MALEINSCGCRFALLSVVALTIPFAGGCVRRTISITSTPSDALVYVNDREIGRTPCEVDFLFYGEYDVRLKQDGYESIIGSGTASAPIWDFIGADLIVEVAPINLESRVEWHFDFIPANNDHAELLDRARQLRSSAQSEQSETATSSLPKSGQATHATPEAPLTPQEQGAIPLKGSSDVPIPPTDLPSNIPSGPESMQSTAKRELAELHQAGVRS